MTRTVAWGALALALALATSCAQQRSATTAEFTATEREPERGRVLRRTLRADQSHEYLLYVPARAAPGGPIFVTVHGISRNVEEHATLFAPLAEEHQAVLIAPYFTRDRDDDYQQLSKGRAGRRADVTLDAIIKEVATATGANGQRFYLFGFSGGAQFSHRYVLAHPERVIAAAIGAAGWYTFPDDRKPYPYGLGPSAERSGLRFDAARFLRVPITVLVGKDDIEGGESLRRNPTVDEQQGTTRLERARRWVEAMNQAARQRGLTPHVTLQEVPGIEHSFREFMRDGELGERVFTALFGSSSSVGVKP
ncbi:MAG TPA: PHB depolymerase family esterase [Candidatus Eisenbacteria bacterium]|nr:PHB depolymerase family esterase [Candidatus Eisenbacteria bacterium]